MGRQSQNASHDPLIRWPISTDIAKARRLRSLGAGYPSVDVIGRPSNRLQVVDTLGLELRESQRIAVGG